MNDNQENLARFHYLFDAMGCAHRGGSYAFDYRLEGATVDIGFDDHRWRVTIIGKDGWCIEALVESFSVGDALLPF